VHRSLGAHITKVRSLDLDDWDINDIRVPSLLNDPLEKPFTDPPFWYQFLERNGNERGNQRWMQFMPVSSEQLTPTTDVYLVHFVFFCAFVLLSLRKTEKEGKTTSGGSTPQPSLQLPSSTPRSSITMAVSGFSHVNYTLFEEDQNIH